MIAPKRSAAVWRDLFRSTRAAMPAMCLVWAACGARPPTGTVARDAPAAPGRAEHRIVGYYASWSAAKGFPATQIPAMQLTHVNYAFANVSEDGRAVLGDPCLDIGWCSPGDGANAPLAGNFRDLAVLEAQHPHLAVLISIGGWSWSENFSDAALTAASREAFARSALDLFIRRWPGVFDGIDIDWEYPVGGGEAGNISRPEDRRNFTLLLAELRRQLDAQGERDGRHYLLTIAAPAGPETMAHLELDRVDDYVDWINVMTYDYHTGGTIAHFNAPLYLATGDPTPRLNVDATVQAYLDAGVPRRELVVGVPFFGRGYGGVPDVQHGLYQPATGPAPEAWGGPGIGYDNLVEKEPRAHGFERFWHDESKVPWLFNAETGAWISYDDAESLRLKADYVRENGLGGIMIWELSDDDGTLLPAITAGLLGRKS